MVRSISISVAALVLGLGTPPGFAQTFPNKTITIIVPFPAGGPQDPLARGIQPALSKAMGQPVIVENRAGATGTVGMNACATAGVDAHILCTVSNDLTVLPYLMDLPFNLERDLAPVTQLVAIRPVLMASGASPFGNFREMIAYARANPGKLNFGSFGEGGGAHQLVEAINQELGTKIVHIPYKGSGPALQAVLANEVNMAVAVPNIALPHAKAGKIKVLAVNGTSRIKAFPEVGTYIEQGFNLNIRNWFGVAASGRAPREAITRVNHEIVTIIKSPDYLEKYINAFYYDVIGNTPDEMAEFMKADRKVAEVLAKVVKDAGYKGQ